MNNLIDTCLPEQFRQWPCIICTYLNDGNVLKCALCLTAKPIIRPSKHSLNISIPKPPINIPNTWRNNTKKRIKSLTPKPPQRNKKCIKNKFKARTLSNFFFSNNNKNNNENNSSKLSIKHSKSNELQIDQNLAKVMVNNKNNNKNKTINISLPRQIILYKLPAEKHKPKSILDMNGINSINGINGTTNYSFACSIYKELSNKLILSNKLSNNRLRLEKYEESIQKHESILLEILKYDINNNKDYNKVIDTIINARCDVICNFLPLIIFTVNLCEYQTNKYINDMKNKLLNKLYDRIIGQSDLRQALIYFVHSYDDIDNVSFLFSQFNRDKKHNCIQFWTDLLSKKQIKENDAFNIESNMIIRDPVKQLSLPIKKIIIRKIINSNSKPLLLDCYCGVDNNNQYLSSTFILKYGDDLRKDKCCMHVFKWINHLFTNSNNYKLKNIKILTYNVIPMGKIFGCIQLINNCIGLRDVSTLINVLKSDIIMKQKLFSNLISTAAGSVIASYVMGVKDRHFDNILIRTNDFTLFHIDYNFIFGETLFGIDANLFGITESFYHLLGKDNYNKFIDLSSLAFIELRHNYKQFINFSCLSFSYVYPYEIITKHIYKKLRMNESDQKSIQWLKMQLQMAPFNKKTKLKNVIHKFATR
eukprot:167702_1